MVEIPLSQEKLDMILTLLRAELEHVLGEQIHSMYLYGSHARGDARPDSDIDVLVVLKGVFKTFEMIERTGEAAARLSLQFDTVISLAFCSIEDYEHRQMPFLMNVRQEGIAI